MAWEQRRNTSGKYYYRSERLPNGRVLKIYCGTGQRGAAAADADRLKRAEQTLGHQRHRALLEHIQHVAAPLDELNEICDVIMQAALLGAGFHQHRGTWRRKRNGRQLKFCNVG